MMQDRELISLIEDWQQNSEGADWSTDGLAEERQLAWDYYLGRTNAKIPALSDFEGVSSIKYTLVHDYVNAVIAQMVPSLCNDNPAVFEPLGPEDRQADAESKAVNKVLMEDNPGYSILYQAAKTSALHKNAFCKVECIEQTRAEVRSYQGLDDEELALLQGQDDVTVTSNKRTGRTEVRQDIPEKRLQVMLVEPGNFAYPRNWHKMTFQDAPFVQERHVYRRSELIRMGYPRSKVEALDLASDSTLPQVNAPNLDRQADYSDNGQKAEDRIDVRETYIRVDMTGSNSPESELWRIVHSGQTILEKTPADLIPYCTGVLYLKPFRCAGESLYEKLRPLQDVGTGLQRSLMDMAQQNAAGGLIVNDQVNEADINNRAIGQDVRCDGDVRMAAAPIPVLDMSAGILQAIEQTNQLAAKRAGASLDLQSGEVQGLEKVTQAGAMATTQMISHQELQAATITRTFAETFVRNLVSLIHETLRRDYDQPVQVTMAGQMVELNPQEWPVRTRINIKTGMSPGERNRKLASLNQVMQVQLMAMGQGMPLANPQTFHALLLDYMKAADLDGGERYFVDPMSPEYMQTEQAMQAQMQQQQQMAAQMETLSEQVKLQIAWLQDATDRLKIAADLEKAEADNATTIGTAEISARASALGANSAGGRQGGNGSVQ